MAQKSESVESWKCGRWRVVAAGKSRCSMGLVGLLTMTGARPRGVPRCRGAARARILLDPGVHWRPDLVGPTGQ